MPVGTAHPPLRGTMTTTFLKPLRFWRHMATQPKVQIVKKKRWLPIVAPKSFNEEPVGETFAAEPAEAVGRTVSVSLMALTGDPQRQHVTIVFKIAGHEGDKLTTDIIGYRILPSALKRLVRRSRDKLDDSFEAVTKDGKKVRIKPVLVCRSKASGSVTAALRKNVRASVANILAVTSYDEFLHDLISGKFQRTVAESVRKIYPLSACEIRWMEHVGVGVPPVVKEVPAVVQEQEPVEAAAEPQPAAEQGA